MRLPPDQQAALVYLLASTTTAEEGSDLASTLTELGGVTLNDLPESVELINLAP